MNNRDSDFPREAEILRRGHSYLLRARAALGIVVLTIVAHLEYLIFPYAVARQTRPWGILILWYPLFLGALVIACLFAGKSVKILRR